MWHNVNFVMILKAKGESCIIKGFPLTFMPIKSIMSTNFV
jgi:hypothetical protein